jgi:Flp pilus assembly pilin Flp
MRMNNLLLKVVGMARNLKQDIKGQDLIEYALMAGFVAVAAGALMPSVSSSISTVFSKIGSVMTLAAGG